MGKHTPRPWKMTKWRRSPRHRAEFEISVDIPDACDGHNELTLAVLHNGAFPIEEEQANARLIAAAPALLEALRITQRSFKGGFTEGYVISVTGHEMEAIQAAISAATDE